MPFRDITGHSALHALLSRAVVRGTLPQSLIFAGPEGVGKRLTALALAQLLNCPQPIEGDDAEPATVRDACGRCPVCRRIETNQHPDVVMAGGETSIDEMREVLGTAAYRPFEGRRRVFVLDGADRLSAIVQNALLKTLEEPAPSSQFVLVASRPDMLLETVRSRCPQLRFGRLPVDEVARLLVERHGLDPLRAREAAFAADGSPGRALADASEVGGALRALAERVVQATAGGGPSQRLRAAQMLLEAGETKRARGRGTKAAGEREQLAERLEAVSALVRDLGVLAAGGGDEWMSRMPAPELGALARRLGPAHFADVFAAIGRAREALERNVSPKAVADWIALKL
ncbi:MAG TPA: AAA family ATPase [Vicinamibacterales bacterium]